MKIVLNKMQFNLEEIAGAFGDVGTFVPLVLALSLQNGFDFATTLFFAGLLNFITSLFFPVPMSIQPMKAIAALSLTYGYGVERVMEATFLIGWILLLLTVTGLWRKVSQLIPIWVVRLIQIYLGYNLILKANDLMKGGLILGLIGIFLVLFIDFLKTKDQLSLFKRIPTLFFILFLGIFVGFTDSGLLNGSGVSLFEDHNFSLFFPQIHPYVLNLVDGGFNSEIFNNFYHSLINLTLPQIPLTLLNSVLAVVVLLKDLYPETYSEAELLKKTQIQIIGSVALMNIFVSFFGSIPFCHGAGGLASQHRFGARTNGSIFFLGLFKMGMAILFGNYLIPFLDIFSKPLLGTLLIFTAFELNRGTFKEIKSFYLKFSKG